MPASLVCRAIPCKEKKGVRRGHRRLRHRHKARRQGRQCPPQSRRMLGEKGRIRQGHRRLQHRDRARPELRHRIQGPRNGVGDQEGLRQGHRRLHRGHPTRTRGCQPVCLQGQLPAGEEGLRRGHRRLQHCHRARRQDANAHLNRGAQFGRRRPNTTKPSPTSASRSGSTRTTPPHSRTVAWRGRSRRTTTRPSPTSPRPSDSNPVMPACMSAGTIPLQREEGGWHGHGFVAMWVGRRLSEQGHEAVRPSDNSAGWLWFASCAMQGHGWRPCAGTWVRSFRTGKEASKDRRDLSRRHV